MSFGKASLIALAMVVIGYASFNLYASGSLQVSLQVDNGGICSGNDGFAIGQATASGATSPYTFTWEDPSRALSAATVNPNYGIINGSDGSSVTMCVKVTSDDGQRRRACQSVTISCGGF